MQRLAAVLMAVCALGFASAATTDRAPLGASVSGRAGTTLRAGTAKRDADPGAVRTIKRLIERGCRKAAAQEAALSSHAKQLCRCASNWVAKRITAADIKRLVRTGQAARLQKLGTRAGRVCAVKLDLG